jgi:predicted lipoprotein with Yx(FWY)xxD motif
MRTLIILSSIVTVAALLAPSAVSAPGSPVATHASRYGTILFDGRGFVLYAFTHDLRGKSRCNGACAKAWPPYLVKGKAPRGRLLGTTRRADGTTQITYAGRPLYYYVADRKPGQILCQNVSEFGGLWLVVRPDGSLVR